MTSQLEKSATGLRRHLSSKEVLELEREYLCNGATETDLTFDHGRGSVVVDADGREYIDFASGVLITNIGHAHPRVTEAMNEATRRSPASYNLPTELRATLCERLAHALPVLFVEASSSPLGPRPSTPQFAWRDRLPVSVKCCRSGEPSTVEHTWRCQCRGSADCASEWATGCRALSTCPIPTAIVTSMRRHGRRR